MSTPPTSLAVGVDKTEYSRFEGDKNTITATVIPGVPSARLLSATIAGVTSLPLAVGFSLPSSGFPYQVTIGSGATVETVTATNLIGNGLVITATVNAHHQGELVNQVVDLTGEVIIVQLIKARRNRDVEVAQQQITLPTDSPVAQTIQFYLPDIVDEDAASKVRRGAYFIRVYSATLPGITADSGDFNISLITVDRFKRDYLHGADRRAMDTLQVKQQPTIISGVTVSEIARGHQPGWVTLSYNYSDPLNGSNPVRLLSWCNGPAVSIVPGQTTYTLRKGTSRNEWIEVTVTSVLSLPSATCAEDLLVDRAQLTDDLLKEMLDSATSWVEQVALAVFIEPTRVVTEIDTSALLYNSGSDIPTFVYADWDHRVDAITFYRASAGHWMNFRMPYYPLIRFDALYGKVSNVRILDIALEWVEIHERGGFVELVPFNQEVAFNFIGLIWVETLRGPIPIPNFWNFSALVGFRDTPQIILEMVGKKAAIDALTRIGQAFRPGLSSQSVSRDGVSESVSYLTSAQYGIFNATIAQYREWIEENLPRLKGAYRGINMQVV
jgi:hypothetical protein